MQQSLIQPIVALEVISLAEANIWLERSEHKMGPLHRGNQDAICHALVGPDGEPVAVATASYLIGGRVQGAPWLTRSKTVELSRLCASRPGLCRVMLRLWREFAWPCLWGQWAMSYQDAAQHSGNIYRFDGWERVGFARGVVDKRTGRPARHKWVWQWPPRSREDA